MSSAIHYRIYDDEKLLVGGYIEGRWVKPPGLDALLEEEKEILTKVQNEHNKKVKDLEEKTHRQFGKFSWDTGFTHVNYTGDDTLALMMFHTIVETSKKLPNYRFQFNDSYYLNVLYQIQNGELVALPEIEIDGELWAWDGLAPEQRNPCLEKAKPRFNYLLTLDPIKDFKNIPASTRAIDYFYIIQDVHFNPFHALEGKGSKYHSVHHENPCDIAKNGKDNIKNLEEAAKILREGIGSIKHLIEGYDLSGIGGSEDVSEVNENLAGTVDEFRALIDGEKVDLDKRSKFHKYQIGARISYVPHHDKDLHRIVHHENMPKLSGEKKIDIICSSSEEPLIWNDFGVEEAREELSKLIATKLNQLRETLGNNENLKWYQIDFFISH